MCRSLAEVQVRLECAGENEIDKKARRALLRIVHIPGLLRSIINALGCTLRGQNEKAELRMRTCPNQCKLTQQNLAIPIG